MSKLLFVVHRYVPFPGGSEYFTRDMAEESLKRGHDVTVLAHVNQGDINGIRVTNDYNILVNEKFDLIVVHGGDVISQDVVHTNAYQINRKSPVLYMLILPSHSEACINGAHAHRFIGYSTLEDINFLKEQDLLDKGREIRHGIPYHPMVRTRVPDGKTIFMSAGGFAPHKNMKALADLFEKNSLENQELHLYGYSREDVPKETEKVKVFLEQPKSVVDAALVNADAYIMHSTQEGFGLVLLEAMSHKVPWIARKIAGAKLLERFGTTYETDEELIGHIQNFKRNSVDVYRALDYFHANHTIQKTVDDIEDVLGELNG